METANCGPEPVAGLDTISLSLAGWVIELRVRPHALAQALADRYAAFCVPHHPPALTVEVTGDDAGQNAQDGGKPKSILQAQLTLQGENYLLDSAAAYGMIAASGRRAALRLRLNDHAYDRRHPGMTEVEYFLRVALALFALLNDGLLVHSAALKRFDSVYLFIGQSGSGKSTVVALSSAAGRADALGDDLILIRRFGDEWQAFGTPFWNLQTELREGQQQQGPVRRIYKLIQDPAVYIKPMGRVAAAAELFANCPIVNDQPTLADALIERCRAVVGQVGVAQLHFRKDDSFWDVISI